MYGLRLPPTCSKSGTLISETPGGRAAGGKAPDLESTGFEKRGCLFWKPFELLHHHFFSVLLSHSHQQTFCNATSHLKKKSPPLTPQERLFQPDFSASVHRTFQELAVLPAPTSPPSFFIPIRVRARVGVSVRVGRGELGT